MKKTPTLTVLIGCPASGKSTYAEWQVRTESKTMRISRDEIRFSQFQEVMDAASESIISKIIYEQIKTLLLNGWNVILDNCNTKFDYIKQPIKDFSEMAHIEFKLFDLPLEELLIRNENRERKVPKKVIENMFHQLQTMKSKFDFKSIRKVNKLLEYEIQNSELPKAIICDLDGTLALMNGRNPFDASKCDEDLLNEPVANVLRNYKKLDYKILLVSGREDRYKEPTLRFLEKHAIEFDELMMRKSQDNRKDSIIKTEIYNDFIKDKYFVEFALDDRNQVVDMWRNDLKLPCFQVYYGDF
ncbi:AAA family ATPase [Flavobacterium sp. F-65]|jgi:predicted kinase|uniref:AAA family ATPase n=1 Tax=Flavobacterium pisciphilum TaxID=2893755 RepID=A0ABS8MQV1_9FLAO|nr:AAA family ATPase [Flavobacterium sp. F-65]MCC9071133.1 AAA family ATPase [Flavobacterium sp. F-65]